MERILPKKDSGENQHLGHRQVVQDFFHQHYVCPKRWPKMVGILEPYIESWSNFIATENTSFGPPKGGGEIRKGNGSPKISGEIGWLVKYYFIGPDISIFISAYYIHNNHWTTGCTPNSVPILFHLAR